ncbi:uncharacterized protein TNCV_4950121 [Trichonephila clavipes]|nr:uncharacterized protein TNCV_4950121 [Trichonephila clavipes]
MLITFKVSLKASQETQNKCKLFESEVKQEKSAGRQTEKNLPVKDVRMPARHGVTLNSHRAASPLVRLVEREERWEASHHPQSVLPLNWGGIESNRSVTCVMLKATANDRRH